MEYRIYLGLQSKRRSFAPTLRGVKVSSRVYFNMLRFIMYSMLATTPHLMKMLDLNNVNTQGAIRYLRRAESLIKLFGYSSDPTVSPSSYITDIGYFDVDAPDAADPREIVGALFAAYGSAFRD